MKIIKFLLLACLFYPLANYAQHSGAAKSSLTIRYHESYPNAPDSIYVCSYPRATPWLGFDRIPMRKAKDKSFSYEFLINGQRLQYRIDQFFKGKASEIGNYYAEPGDAVNLLIHPGKNGDSLVYSGKGSAKYQLIEKLLAAETLTRKSLKPLAEYAPIQTLDSGLNALALKLKAAMAQKNALIESYRQQISEQTRQLIGYQYANYDSSWSNYLIRLRSQFKSSPGHLEKINSHFKLYYPIFLDRSAPISLYSPRHFQLLVNLLGYDLLFNNNGKVDYKSYYDQVKAYSSDPKIRERLICQFFWSGALLNTNYSQRVSDSLLRDADPLLKSEGGRELIAKNLLYKKGTPLFETTFETPDGKIFDTRSLRGKAFLIDIWGNGCGACILFHKWFEREIWPAVKDLDGFTVLSVFNGKSRATWKQCMKTDQYTSAHYQNVAAISNEVLGPPFFKHYSINYSPFLLLVDKRGKIVAKLNGTGDDKEFIKLLTGLASEPYKDSVQKPVAE